MQVFKRCVECHGPIEVSEEFFYRAFDKPILCSDECRDRALNKQGLTRNGKKTILKIKVGAL